MPVVNATSRTVPANIESVAATVAALEQQITRVVVGQPVLMRRLLTALFAAIPYAHGRTDIHYGCGHVLLEGVPGVAKTLTATTLAQGISVRFQRIQLTADMLPADIVGTRIYEAATASFRVERGPVFTNILLADEINRATPKTQSALLEAMQERQVTVAETTYKLDDPFWVLATQNPIEQEGVYTLPEAQLDRFSLMVRVDYPSAGDEIRMLSVDEVRPESGRLITPGEVVSVREMIRAAVHIDDRIPEYIVRLGRATRAPADVGRASMAEMITAGISPRSYQHILALARVNAFLEGRLYVLPGDVKAIFPEAARHRIVRTLRAQAASVSADALVADILGAVPIP